MNKSYRIRTNIGEEQTLKFNLKENYNLIEVLSLKLKQEDFYKLYASDYGTLVGRVVANDGFGVPNAKISIFINKNELINDSIVKEILYPFNNISVKDHNNIRYNLLPVDKLNDCHQNVGTFPSKRYMLDNDVILDIYDNYYKFTTTSNEAGDYMIFGVPTGNHTLHVDLDLSDVGILSQKPRDMIYKGYNINQFESPNVFKNSTNLDSLPQLYSETTTVFIYPFWGDETVTEVAISRKDVNLQYKFEPTCVFMGSVFTDSSENVIYGNCKSSDSTGQMNTLISTEGNIEMIRKTFDDRIESYIIEGNRLIDANGVFCYQIPMNLDYIVTDEFGNKIPTNNPSKGIPTRTRVRFKITLDNVVDEYYNKKKGSYLIPHNPKTPNDLDFEFGVDTNEKSFVDLFWNKVYSVKNYIPRFQVGNKTSSRHFMGLKTINHYGQNNPLPYNNLLFKNPLTFRLLCIITMFVIDISRIVNWLVSVINVIIRGFCIDFPNAMGKPCIVKIFGICVPNPLRLIADALTFPICKLLPSGVKNGIYCITFSSFCDEDRKFAPGCWKPASGQDVTNDESVIKVEEVCAKNKLAQETGVLNFDFYNDWINGSLYAPSILIETKKNKKNIFFGIFGSKTIGYYTEYCGMKEYNYLNLVQGCTPNTNLDNIDKRPTIVNDCGKRCHQTNQNIQVNKGLVIKYFDKSGLYNYYYNPCVFTDTTIYLLNADIILLGGLNECDIDGIPAMHQLLPSTTFNRVPDLIVTEVGEAMNSNGSVIDTVLGYTDTTGADWGIMGRDQCDSMDKGKNDRTYDGGLFLRIDCTSTTSTTKSCINAQRVCELGVSLDSSYSRLRQCKDQTIIADGYISQDNLIDSEVRQMFATLNGNHLKTEQNMETGYDNYVFYKFYPENFDGRLANEMTDHQRKQGGCTYISPSAQNPNSGYFNSYVREYYDRHYYNFRFGLDNESTDLGTYYDRSSFLFPRYENSYYFYFGIKPGSTAIDKFNTLFYAPCPKSINKDFDVRVNVVGGELVCPCNSIESDITIRATIEGAKLPYSIVVHDQIDRIIYEQNDLNKNIVVLPNNINFGSGVFRLTIIDADNISVTSQFTVPQIGGVRFRANVIPLNGDSSNINCNNYFGKQNFNESTIKAKIRLTDFDNIILDKGCLLNKYNISIIREFRYTTINGDTITVQEDPIISNLYDWVNTDGVKTIINGITYYNIFACEGRYWVTISNNEGCEDSFTMEVNIPTLSPLTLLVNDVNVNNLLVKRDGSFRELNMSYWDRLYKSLMKGEILTEDLITYPNNVVSNKDKLTFNNTILNAFVIFCNPRLSIRSEGGQGIINHYLCGKGLPITETIIEVDNIYNLPSNPDVNVIYSSRGIIPSGTLERGGRYIVHSHNMDDRLIYNGIEYKSGDIFIAIIDTLGTLINTYSVIGNPKLYISDYVKISNNNISILHKEYYKYQIDEDDSYYISYNKHIWVNNITQASYLTSFRQFSGEYSNDYLLVELSNGIKVYSLNSGNNNSHTLPRIAPNGVATSINFIDTSEFTCKSTNLFYCVGIVDNNGTGMAIPYGLNNIVTDIPLTLDEFEIHKNDVNLAPFSFTFPLIDKRLMFDFIWSKNNSTNIHPNNRIGSGVYYANIRQVIVNGSNDILIDSIALDEEEQIYDVTYIYPTTNISTPSLRSLNLDINNSELDITSIRVSDNSGCTINTELNTLTTTKTISEFNRLNNNEGYIEISLVNYDEQDNYLYYLINAGVNYTTLDKQINNVRSDRYNFNLIDICPPFPSGSKFIDDNSFYQHKSQIDKSKIKYNINQSNVFYVIYIDSLGVRTFSTPIDLKKPTLLFNSDDYLEIKMDNIYNISNYTYILYKWDNAWVKIDENSFTNIKTTSVNDNTINYKVVVKDISGLNTYGYFLKDNVTIDNNGNVVM